MNWELKTRPLILNIGWKFFTLLFIVLVSLDIRTGKSFMKSIKNSHSRRKQRKQLRYQKTRAMIDLHQALGFGWDYLCKSGTEIFFFFSERTDCNRVFLSPVSLQTYPSCVKRFWFFLVKVEWTSPGPSQKLEESSSGNSNLSILLDIIDNLWRGTFVDLVFFFFFPSLPLRWYIQLYYLARNSWFPARNHMVILY